MTHEYYVQVVRKRDGEPIQTQAVRATSLLYAIKYAHEITQDRMMGRAVYTRRVNGRKVAYAPCHYPEHEIVAYRKPTD